MTPLDVGDHIRYRHKGNWEPAKILSKAETPRSYNILTDKGTIVRRNRQHLLQTNETHDLTTPRRVMDDLNVPTPRENSFGADQET